LPLVPCPLSVVPCPMSHVPCPTSIIPCPLSRVHVGICHGSFNGLPWQQITLNAYLLPKKSTDNF
jgi:hypothetical protein